MKITGIITEYNPFHNGHRYHLKQSRLLTNSDYVICVMNGNFMQRGTPAITDKWSRTAMAVENGVDLVLELPLVYGIRSAEFFAEGTVKLLADTGIVNSIVFGSEIGEIKPLKLMADMLVEEPKYFQKKLKDNLEQGLSFPGAREKALLSYFEQRYSKTEINLQKLKDTISKPNNILGLEYLKAINKYKIKITPYTIQRTHDNYHSENAQQHTAGAGAIRNIIYDNNNQLNKIKNLVPPATHKIISSDISSGKIPIKKDYLGIMILTRLRQCNLEQLNNYAEMGTGLASRILEFAHETGSLPQLISSIKTRSFTWTRIQRNLLHIFFGLTAADFNFFDNFGPRYLRVLGFNKKGEKLLTKIKQNSLLPIITQPAKYLKSKKLKSRDPLLRQLSYDLLASDIYSLLYKNSEKRNGHQDYYHPVIKTNS